MSLLPNVYLRPTVAGYEECPLPPPNAAPVLKQLRIQLPPIVSELHAHKRMEERIQIIDRVLENSTNDRLLALGKTILIIVSVAAFVLGCTLVSSPAMFGVGSSLIFGGFISYFISTPILGSMENEKTRRLENFLRERGSCSSFRNCFFGSPLSVLTAFLVIPHLVFPLWSAFSRHAKLENGRTELIARMNRKATEIQQSSLDQDSITILGDSEKLNHLLRVCNETILIFEDGKFSVDSDSVPERTRALEHNPYLDETRMQLRRTQAAIDYLEALKTFLQAKIGEVASA